MPPLWFSFCFSDYFLSLHWLLSLYLPLQLVYPGLFSSYMPTHDLNPAKISIATYSLIISPILLSPHHLFPELYICVFSCLLDILVKCPLQIQRQHTYNQTQVSSCMPSLLLLNLCPNEWNQCQSPYWHTLDLGWITKRHPSLGWFSPTPDWTMALRKDLSPHTPSAGYLCGV